MVNMKKRILFVSQTAKIHDHYDDPSTRYRCHTPAAALKRRGHITAVVSQREFERDEGLRDYFDFMVFHRPYLTENFVQFLDRNKPNKNIVADFDDLIFDVKYSSLMPSHRFRGQPLHSTSTYLAANAAACGYFENFSVSTTPLSLSVKRCFGEDLNIRIMSNSLEPGYINRAAEIRKRASKGRPYKVGYFAGTATHDADFDYISESLAKMFIEYPKALMLVLGPAEIPEKLIPFKERIHHFKDLVHFTKLPYVMAQVETVIAPLEWNEFTVCKSGLKFFEAALVGCSVVATPIPDIERFESPLLRKCRTKEQWDSALISPFDLSQSEIEHEIPTIVSHVNSEEIAANMEREFFL